MFSQGHCLRNPPQPVLDVSSGADGRSLGSDLGVILPPKKPTVASLDTFRSYQDLDFSRLLWGSQNQGRLRKNKPMIKKTTRFLKGFACLDSKPVEEVQGLSESPSALLC